MLPTRFLRKAVVHSREIFNTFINFAVLQTYKSIKGNLKIAPDYVVGETYEDAILWPPHYLGFKLGSYAQFISSGIQKGLYNASVVENLKKMGFEYTHSASDKKREEHILLAASTYVRLQGDSVVPSSFRVPVDSLVWPKETWGLKLGQYLMKMRHNPSYLSSIRQQLIDAGISFDPIESPQLTALKVFKSTHGHIKVPSNFVIPVTDERYPAEMRGFELGKWLRYFRKYSDAWPEYAAQLKNLGIKKTKRGKTTAILSAASTYVIMHGNGLVPRSFQVPQGSSDWPAETWGLRLGKIIQRMRLNPRVYATLRPKLIETGISFESRAIRGNYNMQIEALRVYKSIHGSVKMSAAFVIPRDDVRYSEAARGCPLGSWLRVYLRSGREKWPQYLTQLEELGVDITPVLNYPQTVLAAAATFVALHGHGEVPNHFRVPSDSSLWPSNTWHLPLGEAITSLRRRPFRAKLRQQLEQLGIDFDTRFPTSLDYLSLVQAVSVYRDINGHARIPQSFRVPVDDPRYPTTARGVKLGKWLMHMRMQSRNQHHTVKLLKELGVDFSLNGRDTLLSAGVTFVRLYGHGRVPTGFVVPSKSTDWPVETWGYHLGDTLVRMRRGAFGAELKQALIEVGINFDRRSKRVDSQHYVNAVRTYRAIHGDAEVPKDYVVPSIDASAALATAGDSASADKGTSGADGAGGSVHYAAKSVGLKLGQWLARVRRELDNNPEVAQQLRELGVRLAIREEYTSHCLKALETYKLVHGHTQLRRNYVVPSDDHRFAAECRGLRLGSWLMRRKEQPEKYPEITQQLKALGVSFDTIEKTSGV